MACLSPELEIMEKTQKIILILVCLATLIVVIGCESSSSYRTITCGGCGKFMTKIWNYDKRPELKCFACGNQDDLIIKCPTPTCERDLKGKSRTTKKCKKCGTLVPMPP